MNARRLSRPEDCCVSRDDAIVQSIKKSAHEDRQSLPSPVNMAANDGLEVMLTTRSTRFVSVEYRGAQQGLAHNDRKEGCSRSSCLRCYRQHYSPTFSPTSVQVNSRICSPLSLTFPITSTKRASELRSVPCCSDTSTLPMSEVWISSVEAEIYIRREIIRR